MEDSGNYPAKRQENYYENQASFVQSDQERGKKQRNGWKVVAILLLGILFCPVWIPLAICVLAIVFTICITLLAVFAALVVSGIALLAGGIGVVIWGFAQIGVSVPGAVVLIGAGFLMTALGLLLTAFFGWLFVKAVVAMFRWFVALCRKPFHKKKDGSAVQEKGGETV